MDNEVPRQILHVDMDAFFAAVEQRDRPELRGRPVLVGGDPNGRGVISAASYEARAFGCRSAMPTSRALRLCPQAVVVRPRMGRYAEASRAVFSILEDYTPSIEPLSIDEAFLDITGSIRLLGPSEGIARDLKRRIRAETALVASVGVAPNKFLAKLASDLEKPDGLVIVESEQIDAFLHPIPIARLWGVGKATLPKFERMSITTFGDARRLSPADWTSAFGDAGAHFHRLVQGLDEREVVPDREAKSISHEVTFAVDVQDHDHLRSVLLGQMDDVARRLRRHGRLARTVTIKIRSGQFKTITRSTTLDRPTDQTDRLWQAASELFEKWSRGHTSPVRLVGAGVSHLFGPEGAQLSLLDQDDENRSRRLDQAVDEIRDRFGEGAVFRGGTDRRKPK